jgi:hypothetical protein
VKRLAVGLLFIQIVFLSSCSEKEKEDNLNEYQQTVIEYFKDVALGFELGSSPKVTRKWNTDMRIFVGGVPSAEMQEELHRIITELNSLTIEDGFSISITQDTLQANSYVFFGSGEDFGKRVAWAADHVAANWGLFYINYDGNDHITASFVYVDIFRATDVNVRKHLLREELTQSLGMARDSEKFPESIFQSSWTLTTEYAEIDRDVIRLLYNPAMTTGLDESEVEPVLKELVNSLNIGR